MTLWSNTILPIILGVTAILAPAHSAFVSHHHSPVITGSQSLYYRQPRQHRLVLFQQQQPPSESESHGDTHLFIRFSPLIGGPAFLPLHVEVIIAVEEANCRGRLQQKMNTICIRRSNNLSMFQGIFSKLHRFDFLPEKPTDPSTLAKLTTFNAVPGRLRYRCNSMQQCGESNNAPSSFNDEGTTNQDGKGITILIPVGSLTRDNYSNTAKDIVPTAMEFNEQYKDTLFNELRILGGKNCLSYVLDLLSHLGSTTGIETIPKLNKLDLQ